MSSTLRVVWPSEQVTDLIRFNVPLSNLSGQGEVWYRHFLVPQLLPTMANKYHLGYELIPILIVTLFKSTQPSQKSLNKSNFHKWHDQRLADWNSCAQKNMQHAIVLREVGPSTYLHLQTCRPQKNRSKVCTHFSKGEKKYRTRPTVNYPEWNGFENWD